MSCTVQTLLSETKESSAYFFGKKEIAFSFFSFSPLLRFYWHFYGSNIFSCPEQLNRTHCPSVPLTKLTIRVFTTLQSDPRDLWPLRHLIRVMKRHDMTKKIDKDKYKGKDNDNDKDKDILRTHPKSNPRDLWPLRDLFRVMRRHDMTQKNWQRQRQRHFENTS